MPESESLIRRAFAAYLTDRPQEGPLGDVARLLATGCESRQQIKEALRGSDAAIREQLLDLLIFFIETCIRDHRLDEDERRAVQQLKRLLGTREGRLFELRRNEVTRLVREEIALVLADKRVEREEALYQATLQEVFDLSYDQYLAVTRDAVRRIIDEAVAAARRGGEVTAEARLRLLDQLRALDTFCPLTEDDRRIILGGA